MSKSEAEKTKWASIARNPLSGLKRLARRPRISGKAVVYALLIALIVATGIALYAARVPSTVAVTSKLYSYRHVADYQYTAYLKPNLLYNNATILPPGEPMYLSLVKMLRIELGYRVLNAELEGGRANITVMLRDPGKWEKNIYNDTFIFTDSFKWSYDINLSATNELANKIMKETGVSTSKYEVLVSATILSSINANRYSRSDRINPSIVITIDRGASLITVEEADGAFPFEETRTSYRTVYLEPEPLKSLNRSVKASDLKLYAYTAVPILTALLMVAWGMLWPHALEKREAEIIREKYGDLMIEISSPPRIKGGVVDVGEMEDLARISTSLGKPILHYTMNGKHFYAVLDGGSAYRYSVSNGDT